MTAAALATGIVILGMVIGAYVWRRPAEVPPVFGLAGPGARATVIAFASGKGGVGKSICAANVALFLARRYSALAVDLDIGCGNLNSCLGVREIPVSIADVVARRRSVLAAKLPTAVENLSLVAGIYGPALSTVLPDDQKRHLVDEIRRVDLDYVVVDLGAGVGVDNLDLFAMADVKVLVIRPESVSLHNAYAFIKALVYRMTLREVESHRGAARISRSVKEMLYSPADVDMGQVLGRLQELNPGIAVAVYKLLTDLRIYLIANMTQSENEARYVHNLVRMSQQYLQVEVRTLGTVPFDTGVNESLNRLVPFAMEYPLNPATSAFEAIADRLERLTRGRL